MKKEQNSLQRPTITLDKWQEDILKSTGNLLLCTGRQVGKTYIFSRKAAERLVSQPNCRIIVASLTEDQAHLIIIMILNHLEQHFKKLIATKKKAPTKSSITLTNGSKVISRPVGNTGDAIRGFTGNVLIIDEASRMPETMWAASKPTLLTTAGEIWMCSTPFGKQGYFYECFLNKYERYKVFHISSEEVINNRVICETWTENQRAQATRFLEEEKRDMSELQYAQEYLGKFIDELRQFFTDECINSCCIIKRSEIAKNGDFFLGCDIARLGGDETTFEIIKRTENNKLIHAESIIKKKQLTTTTFDNILDLEILWNFRKIGIDAGSGSLGVGILDFLLREPKLKKKLVALNNLQRNLDYKGERKRTLLKEDMYFNLQALMEKNIISLLDDDLVRISLKSVQYEYIIKEGEPTKIRIFGRYTHIAEGLVRAAWLANQKNLNRRIYWF